MAINSQGNINLRLSFAPSVFRSVYEFSRFRLFEFDEKRPLVESGSFPIRRIQFFSMSFHVANLKIRLQI